MYSGGKGEEGIKKEYILRVLRFIARIQCEYWLPYRSIVYRLYEEHLITEDLFPELFGIDARDREGEYYRIFNSINPKMCTLLNQPTWKQGISTGALEIIIQNYEDGDTSEEEFCRCLDILGYSDLLLGYGIVHSFLRLIGFNMFSAYKWTLIIYHVFGTVSMYYLLRKTLKCHTLWAMFGTIGFCFSNDYAIHISHTQLNAICFSFGLFFLPIIHGISHALLAYFVCCILSSI